MNPSTMTTLILLISITDTSDRYYYIPETKENQVGWWTPIPAYPAGSAQSVSNRYPEVVLLNRENSIICLN
jgi:hypothetical protein